MNTESRSQRGINPIVLTLAIIGAVSTGVIIPFGIVLKLIPSYYDLAIEAFGSEEVISDIRKLYQRVDSQPLPTNPIEVASLPWPFSSVRRVPSDWVPESIKTGWTQWMETDSSGVHRPFWGDVIAYFDMDEKLLGIEFYGSRFGCFVSESAAIGPPWFESLHRIAGPPIYVSIRLTDSD